MTDPLSIARRYFQAIESGDEPTLLSLLDREIVYRELPNRLVPEGSLNDRAAMLQRFAKGKAVLSSQRYEVVNAVAVGEKIALEVSWTGVLAIPLGSLAAGDTMRVSSGIFLEVREGRIIAQRNYDCVSPF